MDWVTFKKIVKVPFIVYVLILIGFSFLQFFGLFFYELFYVVNGVVIALMFYVGYITTKEYKLPIEDVSYVILVFVGVAFLLDAIYKVLGYLAKSYPIDSIIIILLLAFGGRLIIAGIPCFVGAWIGKRGQHS